MVRLKDCQEREFQTTHCYFNSTMVRLKVFAACLWLANLRFQFHYGTIKSSVPVVDDRGEIQFQFHYGTIKSLAEIDFNIPILTNFNSTMVRLKGYMGEDL